MFAKRHNVAVYVDIDIIANGTVLLSIISSNNIYDVDSYVVN